jgi:hypothetical protein
LQPSGAKSWAVRFRFEGRPRKLTLGWLSLAAARAAAANALLDLEQGRDPGKAKQAAKAKAEDAAADTVQAICREFLKREGARLRSARDRERIFERLVYPKIGTRPIAEIKRTDIVRLLDHIEDANGSRMAHQTLAMVRRVGTRADLMNSARRSCAEWAVSKARSVLAPAS